MERLHPLYDFEDPMRQDDTRCFGHLYHLVKRILPKFVLVVIILPQLVSAIAHAAEGAPELFQWDFSQGFSLSKKTVEVDTYRFASVKQSGIQLNGSALKKFSPVRDPSVVPGSPMAQLLRFGVSGQSIGLDLPIVPDADAESYSLSFYVRDNSTKNGQPIKIYLNKILVSSYRIRRNKTNWEKIGPFEFSLPQSGVRTSSVPNSARETQPTKVQLVAAGNDPIKVAAIEVLKKRRKQPTSTPSHTVTATPPPSSTPEPTPTQTPSVTATRTVASTATGTPTATAVATQTPTHTATAGTTTPSPTPTRTPTTPPTATPTGAPPASGHPYTRFTFLMNRSLSDPAVSRFLSYVNGVRAGGSQYGFEPYYYVYAKLLTGDQSYCTDAVRGGQQSVDAALTDISAGRPPTDLVYNSYLYAGGIIQNLMVILDHCIGNMSQQQVATWSRLAAETAYNLRVRSPDGFAFHDDAHYTKANGSRVNANFSGWPFGNQANNYTYQHNRVFAYAGVVLQASHPQVLGWLLNERIATLGEFLELMYATNSAGQVVSGGGSFEGHDYGVFNVWTGHIARLLKDSGIPIPASFDKWAQAQAHAVAHMILPTATVFESHSLIGSGAGDRWAGYRDLDLHHAGEILRMLAPESQPARALRWVMKRSRTPYSSEPNRSYYDYNSANDLLYVDGTDQQPDLLWRSPGAGYLSVRSSWSGAASHLFAWAGGLWEESHLAGGDIRGHVQLFANGRYQLDNGDQLAGGPGDVQNYHNVLRFTGRGQNDEPGQISSTSLSGGVTQVVMNMSNCYDTGVNWVRTLTYNPTGRELIIRDTWNPAVANTAKATFAVANATASGNSTALLNSGSARFDVIAGGTLSISSITGGKIVNVAASGGSAEYKVTW
jgi:hypothetical protein